MDRFLAYETFVSDLSCNHKNYGCNEQSLADSTSKIKPMAHEPLKYRKPKHKFSLVGSHKINIL